MAAFDYLYGLTSNNNDYPTDWQSNQKPEKKVLIDFNNLNGQTFLTPKETLFAKEIQPAIPLKQIEPKPDFSIIKFAPKTKLIGIDTTKLTIPKDDTKSKVDTVPVDIPRVGNERKPFGEYTMSLMYKIPHKTKLLNLAQDHLGIQEVTTKEYKHLPSKDNPPRSVCLY